MHLTMAMPCYRRFTWNFKREEVTLSGRRLRVAPRVEATPVGQGCGRQGYLHLVVEKKECLALKLTFQKGFSPHAAPKARRADAPGTEAFPAACGTGWGRRSRGVGASHKFKPDGGLE